MKQEQVDAVLVGSGAGGGIVAKELAVAGWRVVLLERGPWLKTFGHVETSDAWFTGIDRVPFGPERTDVRTVRASDREKARRATECALWQLKHFYRTYFPQSIWFYATCHTLPRAENRVDTDPEVRDARGVPVSRITYRQHARNAGEEQFMADRCAELLEEAGAIKVVKPRIVRESEAGISTHQLGSCRMGSDPASSVADRTGRVHGIPNVYIADGSLLVNPGGANPSLTIQALAYWVSAAILRDHTAS